jgi:hypothetical protein
MLQMVNWDFLDDDSMSLDYKCCLFHAIINEAANISVPVSYVRFTIKDKPWITPVVKDLINKRWMAFRCQEFQKYNHLKHKVRKEILKAKILWTKRMTGKNLWQAVNTHLSNKLSNPMMSLLSSYENVEIAVEAINKAFANVFLPDTKANFKIDNYTSRNCLNVEITPEIVKGFIKKASSKKSSPDLPVALYKHAGAILAKPLCKLFSASLHSCIVPLAWKVSCVCPIPKVSTPSLQDLRPISLIPFPAKLLEQILVNFLKPLFLNKYGDDQYGFRPSSSTTCALIALDEHLSRYLDDRKTCGALIVSYDYSKAFDTLRSDIIVRRLMECDFPVTFVRWITSYLSDRKQFVQIGLSRSREVNVTSGVPQGSVLRPYIFALSTASYKPIHDGCEVIKYADDTTLCFPVYASSATNEHINQEHENLLNWSTKMDLKMNKGKCKAVYVPKRNATSSFKLSKIPLVASMCILGVHVDSSGSWSIHVRKTIKKACSRLYAVRLLKPCLSSSHLKQIYNATVRSILEYCAPLFLGISTSDSNQLERLQRRFHRMICGNTCSNNCLPTLEKRRQRQAMNLLHKAMKNNHVLNKYLPKLSRSGRFLLPVRHTTRRCRSFFLLACEMFNHLRCS